MTREEHIYQLKQYLQGKSISMCPASSLYWQEHWEEVIKALEQEPFINKPCVSSEVCEHDKQKVLDKIKAQIYEEAAFAYADFDRYKEEVLYADADELPDDDFRFGMLRCIEIINRYKQ